VSNSLIVNEAWVRSLVRDLPIISDQEYISTLEHVSGARYVQYAHLYMDGSEEKLKISSFQFIGDAKGQDIGSTVISDERMVDLFHNLWPGSEPCPVKKDNHYFLPIFERLIKASGDDLNAELIDWTGLAKEINNSIYTEAAHLYQGTSLAIEDILSISNIKRKVILLVELALKSTEDQAKTFNDLIKGISGYQRVIGEEFKHERKFTDENLQVGGMTWWKNRKYDNRMKQR